MCPGNLPEICLVEFVYTLLVYLGVFLSGNGYLGCGATDRHEVLHGGRAICPGRDFYPFGGDIFRGTQVRVKKRARLDHFGLLRHRFLSFDHKYLKNGMLQHYMSVGT